MKDETRDRRECLNQMVQCPPVGFRTWVIKSVCVPLHSRLTDRHCCSLSLHRIPESSRRPPPPLEHPLLFIEAFGSRNLPPPLPSESCRGGEGGGGRGSVQADGVITGKLLAASYIFISIGCQQSEWAACGSRTLWHGTAAALEAVLPSQTVSQLTATLTCEPLISLLARWCCSICRFIEHCYLSTVLRPPVLWPTNQSIISLSWPENSRNNMISVTSAQPALDIMLAWMCEQRDCRTQATVPHRDPT